MNVSKLTCLTTAFVLTMALSTPVFAQSEDEGAERPDPMNNASEKGDVFKVFLKDGSTLIGEIQTNPTIVFKSTIGKIGLPFSNLVAIEFKKDNKVRVLFTNGDRLSGEIENKTFALNAKWGKVELKTEEVTKVYLKDMPKTFSLVKGTFAGSRVSEERLIFLPDQPRSTPRTTYPRTTTNPSPYSTPFGAPRAAPPRATPSPRGATPLRATPIFRGDEPRAAVGGGRAEAPAVMIPARTSRPKTRVDYTKDKPVASSPDAKRPAPKAKTSSAKKSTDK